MADPEIEELFGATPVTPVAPPASSAEPAHLYPDVTEGEQLPFATEMGSDPISVVRAEPAVEPQFESWWVPPVAAPERVPTHSTAVHAALEETVSMRTATPAMTTGTPALESWWVPARPTPQPGGSAAVAIAMDVDDHDAEPARPGLAIVPNVTRAHDMAESAPTEPPPALRLVSSEPESAAAMDASPMGALEPDDVPLFAMDAPRSGHGGAFRVSPEDSSAAVLDAAWMQPEAEAAPLPQPWWAPRSEPEATTADETVAAQTISPPTVQTTALPVPPQVPAPKAEAERRADVRAAAPARVTPAATARPHVAPGKPRALKGAPQSTRPVFLAAALVAILLGGGYAVYSNLTPAATPLAQPQPAAPRPMPAAAPIDPLAGTELAPTPAAPVTQPGDIDVTVVALAPKPAPTPVKPVPKKRPAPARNAKPVANRGQAPPPPVASAPVAEVMPTPSSSLPTGVAVLPAAAMSTAPALHVPSETFEIGAVDVKPEIRRRIEPRYPESARERGVEDVVIVRVLVTPSGQPADTRLLRRSKVDAAFDDAAVAAVRQWTFSPARKRDRAVACWLNVGVPFRAARPFESR